MLSPILQRGRLPIGLVPIDEEMEIHIGNEILRVAPGTLAVMPMNLQWEIPLERNVRIVAVTISESALQSRRAGWLPVATPRQYPSDGLAAIFIKSLVAAASEIERLSVVEWQSLEQVIADLFQTMVVEADDGDAAPTPSVAALFNRVTLTIERHLHDPELTAGRIARLEGISERYLQKLFEQNGESFSHYLRERRLQRARTALVAPGDIRTPVADVAYNCGFGDAANFNRLFKERFGLPPGAFRNRHADKLAESASAEQRGWPVKALAHKKHQQRVAVNDAASADINDPSRQSNPATHHHLAVSAANVHWGYFSRALKPVLEIRSGDTVEVETLTQHASDDPALMIQETRPPKTSSSGVKTERLSIDAAPVP